MYGWISVNQHLEVNMSNYKQSSIDWLVEKMLTQDWYTYKSLEYIEQAKAMHKEEIKNAFTNGFISHLGSNRIADENFYNETFGGNK